MTRREYIKLLAKSAAAGVVAVNIPNFGLINKIISPPENFEALMKPPPQAVEEDLLKRSISGKAFILPPGSTVTSAKGEIFNLQNGAHQHKHLIGAIHYPNNGWQDVDTRIIIEGGKNIVNKVWYDFEQLATGIGFDYVSKIGGRRQVSLLEINDVPVDQLALNINPIRSANELRFFNVLPGFDIIFRCRPLFVEIFKRLNGEDVFDGIPFGNTGYPISLTWLIREFSPGVIVSKKTRGKDNEELKSRTQEKTQYNLEIKNRETILNATDTLLREELTGRIWFRDQLTREQVFLTKTNVVYPILVDQSTFTITTDGDDGEQYGDEWYPSVQNFDSDDRPAHRFTSVTIDQGADVTLAEETVEVASSGSANCTALGAFDEDNTITFSTANRPSLRSLTSTIATGAIFGSTGDVTIDVTVPVQAVIDRGGFSSGNAIGFFYSTNTGTTVGLTDYSTSVPNSPRLAITVAAGVTRRKVLF